MSRRPHYVVTAERDGRFWFLRVLELERAFTQARRLDEAEAMARDLISLLLEVEPDTFNLEIRPTLLEDADVREALEARRTADREARRASAALRRAARSMAERGLPMRDVGALLGISHQRVSQLLAGGPLPEA